MKFILTTLLSFGLVVSGFSQTRNVVADANGTIVQPTNIWTANATNARSGLGLGSAATNPASAFQPSSVVLSNLASGNSDAIKNGLGLGPTNTPTFNGVALGLSSIESDGNLGFNFWISGTPRVRIVYSGVNSGSISLDHPNWSFAFGSNNINGPAITRSNLGLGSAATNPASAFQPSSSALTNLSLNNGGSLTNVVAANITGTVALASNVTETVALASNVIGVIGLENGGTSGTNAASARVGLGATALGANLFTIPNPDDVRFLRINANNTVSALTASDFRNALSIGTGSGTVTSVGMTVPNIFSLSTPTITSSGTFAITIANQTSRQVFIAPNGGGIPSFRAIESDDLPSLVISKITGLQNALDGKLSTSGTATLATNVTGVVALVNGGTGATNVSDARSNLGLGSAATSAASAFQPSSSVLTNLAANNGSSLTNLNASSVVGTVGLASNITGTASLATNVTGVVALANGGTAGTNAESARTGLGATTVGGAVFTLPNPNAVRFLRYNADNTVSALSDSDFRTAINLGSAATNPASAFQPASANLTNLASNNGSNLTNIPLAGVNGALATNGNAINLTNFPTIPITSGGTGGTNAETARTLLGLGSAATNASSVFQPASSSLTNLASNNGANLTNIPVIGVVGALATNGNATNLTNFPASLLRTDGSAAGLTNFPANILFTNGNGAGLTNLTAANVTGTVAIASNVTGTIAISNGGSGATTAGGARTNLGLGWSALTNSNEATALLGYTTNGQVVANTGTNVLTFTNTPIVLTRDNGDKVSINGAVIRFENQDRVNLEEMTVEPSLNVYDGGSNYLIISPIASQTRTNLGLGWSALTNTNAANFRTAAGLGQTDVVTFQKIMLNGTTSALFPFSIGQKQTQGTNERFYGLSWDGQYNGDLTYHHDVASISSEPEIRISSTAITVYSPITFASGSPQTRTNLGLGWSALTNTNAATSLLGFNADGQVIYTNTNTLTFTNSNVSFQQITLPQQIGSTDGNINFGNGVIVGRPSGQNVVFNVNGTDRVSLGTDGIILYGDEAIGFSTNNTTGAAQTRTNLGLGWPALTNSNAGTGLVSVNTNGDVISPTNFWQRAPIQTLVQDFTGIVTSQTNNATNARNVYVYSLATNVSSVSNTVILPTNTSTFNGDEVTVIHKGTTNTTTIIRQAGSTNNLVTLNKFDESVKFIRELGQWDFYHNISFVEPIQFSGTNVSVNIAATRTNLGLGSTNDVEFNRVIVTTGENAAAFRFGTNQTGFWSGGTLNTVQLRAGGSNVWIATTNQIEYTQPAVYTAGLRNTGTFTNNGDVTINQTTASNGLLYIRRTNNEPFLGLANLIASNNTTVNNETLFRVGVTEATNKSAQFGFRVTNTNGDGVAVFSVFGYNALAMIGPSTRSIGGAAIEADIYSINPTNKVMTLITTNTGATLFHRPIEFNNTTNSAVTRTNLGLGETDDVTFSNVTASGTLTATSTVTAKTNLVVEGFVDFTTNRTNATPVTPNTPARWIQIRVGTNVFYLPAHQ